MKTIYFASSLMWDADADALFAMAQTLGAGGIELWAQQADDRDLDLKRLRTLKESTGIDLVVHAKSWDLNYAALNARIRDASVAEIKASIDIAAAVGAEEITVHPPRYTLKPSEEARDLAYHSILDFVAYGKARGVMVSMEVMEHIKKEMATTPEEMCAIVRDANVCYTVDVAHCKDEAECFDNIQKLGRVSKLHISNKQGTKLHTPLPDGDFDFAALLPRLEALGIPMTMEGPVESGDYTTLKRNFKFINTIKENLK